MNVVIALCGESCVGKTAVAKLVAERLRAQIRHCGEIAKARANELRIDVRNLPDQEHKAIDRKTQTLARESQGVFVMEGRFLNRVLEGVPNVLTIRLECSDEERARRSKSKTKVASLEEIQAAKKADGGEKLHGNQARSVTDQMILNTDGLTPDQVANSVLSHLEIFLHDAT